MIAQAFLADGLLADDQVRQTLYAGLENRFSGQDEGILYVPKAGEMLYRLKS